jgi:hypothetical protein
MSFRAQFGGRCGGCDERIHEGDLVKYDDDQLVHVGCDVTSLPNDRDDLGAVCRSCWLIHSGECA